MALTLLGLGLTGCGGDSWLGTQEAPPLPGKRVSVMLLGGGPTADPQLANVPIVLPPPRNNASWPQYGGDPTHVMQHVAASENLRRVWRASVGSGASGSARLLGRPVVANGRVVAVDGSGTVGAFGAADGARLWSVPAKGADSGDRLGGGGAAIDDDAVYVALAGGDVVSLDAASGREIWRRSLRAPLRAAPTVARGVVLVRTADNQTFALPARTGEIGWRHAGIAEQAGMLGSAPPAVSGDFAVVTYASGEVYALALDSGRPIWSDTLQRPRRTLAIGLINDISNAPLIDRNTVFVAGSGGEMAALTLENGDRVWDLAVATSSTPWLAGEFLFAVTDRGEVVCLLRQNGRVRWVAPLNGEEGRAAGSTGTLWVGPLLVGGRLLLANAAGDLVSLSPYSGELLGRTRVGGRISQAPVVADGYVYVLSDDAELVAYR